MIATEGKICNVEIRGLDPNLIYRAADLHQFFEVDTEIASRLEKLLTVPGIIEKPAGVRVGRHILVSLRAYLYIYDLVAPQAERAGGQGR
ncbi:MAG: hypothetical protein ACK526_13975 [Planctomyces sp.]|jgi:hypothetical protein